MNSRKQIAYRCPTCGVATISFLGNLATRTDMLRLRCACKESTLTIQRSNDGKIRLSTPCVYCKSDHASVISTDIVSRDVTTRIPCPFSGMDILFIADESEMTGELDRSLTQLNEVLSALEAEDLSDIQPQDVDEEDAPPDPGVYDIFNFLLRDLEADGAISCPCDNGEYDLRFTEDGVQIYCKSCGASRSFTARTAAMAEDYLSLSEIKLG